MSLTNRIEKLEIRLQTRAALNREIEMLLAELRLLCDSEGEFEQLLAECEAEIVARRSSCAPDPATDFGN